MGQCQLRSGRSGCKNIDIEMKTEIGLQMPKNLISLLSTGSIQSLNCLIKRKTQFD